MTKQKLSLRHSAAFRELSQPSSNGLSHLFSVTKRKKTQFIGSFSETDIWGRAVTIPNFSPCPSTHPWAVKRTQLGWKQSSLKACWLGAQWEKDMKCGMCQRFSSPSPYFFEQCVAVLWLLSRGGPPSYLTAVGCTRGSGPLSDSLGSQRLLSQSEAASELISDSLTS